MSEDEKLAESLRKYPIIYDKGKSSHKDVVARDNAGNKVVRECEQIRRQRNVYLKKRFNKRRKKYNKVNRLGTSRKKVLKAKQAFDEYSFLSWLEPFVQLRATVSNVPNASSRDRELEQEDEDESSDSSKDDVENISDHHGDADTNQFNSTRIHIHSKF